MADAVIFAFDAQKVAKIDSATYQESDRLTAHEEAEKAQGVDQGFLQSEITSVLEFLLHRQERTEFAVADVYFLDFLRIRRQNYCTRSVQCTFSPNFVQFRITTWILGFYGLCMDHMDLEHYGRFYMGNTRPASVKSQFI